MLCRVKKRPRCTSGFLYLRNMKKWLLLLWISAGWCQTPTKDASIPFKADVFCGRDASGALYGILDNTFFRQTGADRVEYRNVSLGHLLRVDLRNPLRMVLFYSDFNTAVLLDNQLNEIQRIPFAEKDPALLVTACGLASQNRLWLYDSLTLRLGLYDLNSGKTTFITQPIPRPVTYASDFNDFYWIDEKGIYYTCNVFGRMVTVGRVATGDGLQLENGRIWRVDGTSIRFFPDGSGVEKTVLDAGKSIKNFAVSDGILSIFTDHEITNYKIPLR